MNWRSAKALNIKLTPASQLKGRKLNNGWVVMEHLAHSANIDNFSASYFVQHESGRIAYLKALDFSRAMEADDPSRALEELTSAFNYERNILEKCRSRSLDRVVIALDDGKIMVSDGPAHGLVQYLIFEMPKGDAREHAEFAKGFGAAWSLRTLHHIATGLGQLHSHGVAHQDLKPSAVWVFDGINANPNLTKLASLGRSSSKSQPAPHEDVCCSGDPAYAPPEYLYGYAPSEWTTRRFGCDAYHLGSMIVFFFMGVPLTPLLKQELDPAHSWTNWSGTFSSVLPYLRDAFNRFVEELEGILPLQLRDDIVPMVRQLCDPDPELRGDPALKARKANPFDMERYVAHFDRLAKEAEYRLVRR